MGSTDPLELTFKNIVFICINYSLAIFGLVLILLTITKIMPIFYLEFQTAGLVVGSLKWNAFIPYQNIIKIDGLWQDPIPNRRLDSIILTVDDPAALKVTPASAQKKAIRFFECWSRGQLSLALTCMNFGVDLPPFIATITYYVNKAKSQQPTQGA